MPNIRPVERGQVFPFASHERKRNYGDSLLNALNTRVGCHGILMLGVYGPRGV
jgi:hypothetical protein